MNGQVAAHHVVLAIKVEPEFVMKAAATYQRNISQKQRLVMKGDVQVCHVNNIMLKGVPHQFSSDLNEIHKC